MQHFFLSPESFGESDVQITDSSVIHQLKNVLRMRPGDSFVALDGLGFEFECEAREISEKRIVATILEKRKNALEPALCVTLYQAMPKKMELFEIILQKCTEIGVSEFVPMITEFCERDELKKRDRLEKILREASEQCERGKIPVVRDSIKFQDVLNVEFSLPILLHSRGNLSPLSSQISAAKQIGKCEIFIGPEGGFSEKEVEAAQKANFKICSLGSRILRTETAAISASSILLLQ